MVATVAEARVSLIVHPQRNDLPPKLCRDLEHAVLAYSSVREVIYFIWLPGDDLACGIFGDTEMGCYEWFYWEPPYFGFSDSAYGSAEAALLALLSGQEIIRFAVERRRA
jgi:hypothetical protein